MKKNLITGFLSITLALFTIGSVFSVWVSATTKTEDAGISDYAFIKPVTHRFVVPDGYISIEDPDDLNHVRSNLTGRYILMNDIDLSGWGYWDPIGDSTESAFRGVFEGNGFAIKNMSINIETVDRNSNLYVGLFGVISSGTVINLALEDSQINVSSNQGKYTVCIGGISGLLGGKIENCYNKGNLSADNHIDAVGGISGNAYSISYCYNEAAIDVSYSGCTACVGGITGIGNDEINCCYNAGYINCKASDISSAYVGGISGTDFGKITNCYNRGGLSLLSENGYAAGITATCHNVAFSYNMAEITSPLNNAYLSGITCHASMTTVAEKGQLQIDGHVVDCYYINTIENRTDPISVTLNLRPLTDSQMKNHESFYGLDFENIWTMSENDGYPVFRKDINQPLFAEVEKSLNIAYRSTAKVSEDTQIINWLSGNEKIAYIDENGEVMAAGRGKATVVVVTGDGQITDCEVIVTYEWWQWLIKIFLFGWIWY